LSIKERDSKKCSILRGEQIKITLMKPLKNEIRLYYDAMKSSLIFGTAVGNAMNWLRSLSAF
jgi:hypothetical protein